MDGYAVRCVDLESSDRLPMMGESAAGHPLGQDQLLPPVGADYSTRLVEVLAFAFIFHVLLFAWQIVGVVRRIHDEGTSQESVPTVYWPQVVSRGSEMPAAVIISSRKGLLGELL